MRRYCNDNCRSGYRADLAHGMIYGCVGMPDTPTNRKRTARATRSFTTTYPAGGPYDATHGRATILVGAQDWHDIAHTCRYCGADL